MADNQLLTLPATLPISITASADDVSITASADDDGASFIDKMHSWQCHVLPFRCTT